MCPTSLNSDSDGNCSLGADVVSCSWGEDDATTSYLQDIVSSWIAAGMVPIFAVGNAGPKCKTSVSPSDYVGVGAVGATDKKDNIVAFSSRGPATKHAGYSSLAPNIMAPGLSISGPSKSGSGYTDFSGTSQAAPHVAGAAALLLSAKPSLSPSDVLDAIFESAVRTENVCGGDDDDCMRCGSPDGRADASLTNETAAVSWPNFNAGYGRLDCLAALRHVKPGV